jgi:hypothetical protein
MEQPKFLFAGFMALAKPTQNLLTLHLTFPVSNKRMNARIIPIEHSFFDQTMPNRVLMNVAQASKKIRFICELSALESSHK